MNFHDLLYDGVTCTLMPLTFVRASIVRLYTSSRSLVAAYVLLCNEHLSTL